MATEKETIILDLKVDQGSAISELEKTKKSIIQLNEQKKELLDLYKKEKISIDAYAEASVKLDNQLKKEVATYNNVQKSVTGVKTKMDDLIKSNQNLTKSLDEGLNKATIFGTNLGGLKAAVTALANPMVAAATLATGLAAAYAGSARGANDLANAQNNLRAGVDAFLNRVGNSTDGGLLERLSRRINIAAANLTNNTKKEADAQKERVRIAEIELKTLRELELDRIEAAGRQKIREKEAENARLIRDNQEKTFTERLNASEQVKKSIEGIETETVGILQKQINALISYGKNTGAIVDDVIIDRNLKIDILKLQNEIADKQEFVSGKLTENVTAQRNLNTELAKQNAELEKGRKALESFSPSTSDTGDQTFNDDPTKSKSENPIFTEAVEFRTAEEIKRDEALKTSMELEALQKAQTDVFLEQQEIRFAAASASTQALSTLAATAFGENSEIAKATGVVEAIVNTYTGATLALRSAPPPLSFALAALTIANGLASVNQITRAAGGGNFVTKGPALMLVGDNPGGRERVTVEPLSGKGQTRVHGNRIAMAGGGTLTTGFDDGGITKNAAVSQMQQALMFTNAIKNLPSPVVGVVQFAEVANQVQVKQSVAKA